MKKQCLLGYNFPSKNAFNIGDYIQSLAALEFLGGRRVDVTVVNRERLSEWREGTAILIMNGWFMHEPKFWPPHPSIELLYISFHINPSVYARFSQEDSVQHFKRFEPIGCRDLATKRFLQSIGIRSYFSGCLTLTLSRANFCADVKRSGVLLCDVAHGKGSLVSLFVRSDITFAEKLVRIPKVLWDRTWFVNSDKVVKKIGAAFSSESITYKTTQLDADIDEDRRFQIAREYLADYARAKLVVTSRIHVALPCLAFGTPVLFVNPEIDNTRFAGLVEFFNSVSISELLATKNEELENLFSNLENGENFHKYRDSLIETVNSYVIGKN